MISCVRYIILIILWILIVPGGKCQKTYYYKFVSCSDSRNTIMGGQFITFVGDICFESDNNGNSVKNGNMSRNSYQSSNEKFVYEGASFCGEDTKFIFNADKSRLNVIGKDGLRYSLVQTNPPARVTTCSFIRSRGSSGSSGGQIPVYDGQISPIYPNNNGGNMNARSDYNCNSYSGSSSGSSNSQSRVYRKDCHLCLGSGKCRTCNGSHSYINPLTNKYVTCPNCKPNGACSLCGGSGKKK